MPTLQYSATKSNDYGAPASSADPYFGYQTYSYTLSSGSLGGMSVTGITGCSITNANTNGSSGSGVWRMQIEVYLNGAWRVLGYIQVDERLIPHQTFSNFTSTATPDTKSLMGKYAPAGVRGKVIEGYFHLNIGSQITLTATAANDYTASTFTCSPTTVDAGATMTVNIARVSTALTHTVQFALGTEVKTYTNVATSQSHTIDLNWLKQMTNAAAASCAVTVYTYAGAQPIGAVYGSFTIRAGDGIKPTLGLLTPTPVNAYWGLYVQGYSKVQLTASGAAGAYDSIPASYSIAGGTTNPTVTGVLKTAGTNTFNATVTDTRGRTSNPASCTVAVTAYSAPAITRLSVVRASDSEGTFLNDGMYCKVTPTYTWSEIGDNELFMTVAYRYAGTDDDWNVEEVDVASGDSVVIGSGATFEADRSYTIRFIVMDDVYGATTSFATLTSARKYAADFLPGGTGVCFGDVATQENALEIVPAWKLKANGSWIGTPSNPNLLINGDFQMWQRGTSFLTAATGQSMYTADRWAGYYYAGQTIERIVNTSPEAVKYAIRAYRASTADNVLLTQMVENYDLFTGYPFTFSFWAKGYGGYTGSFTVIIGNALSTINLSNEWTRYELSVSAWEYGTGASRRGVAFQRSVGVGQGIEIAACKLEPGSIATKFVSRTFPEDQSPGKRYCLQLNPNGISSGHIGVGVARSTTQVSCLIPLPVSMRVTPSLVIGAASNVTCRNGGTSIVATGITVGAMSANFVQIYITGTGFTTGAVYEVYWTSSASVLLDAEIY